MTKKFFKIENGARRNRLYQTDFSFVPRRIFLHEWHKKSDGSAKQPLSPCDMGLVMVWYWAYQALIWAISEAETDCFAAPYRSYRIVIKRKWLAVNTIRNPLKTREFATEETAARKYRRIFELSMNIYAITRSDFCINIQRRETVRKDWSENFVCCFFS